MSGGWGGSGRALGDVGFEPKNAETAELLAFINRQIESWVEVTRRLASPRIVIDLLEWSGRETQALFESLEAERARTWRQGVGERESANWFDLAREYAERWHHQAQIREAVGAPMLYEPRLFAPLIATMVRGVPHKLRTLDAPEGTHIRIVIKEPNTAVSLVREGGGLATEAAGAYEGGRDRGDGRGHGLARSSGEHLA